MPGFSYKKYNTAVNYSAGLIDDIGLIVRNVNDYKRIMIDAMKGKIEFKGMKDCFEPETLKTGETPQGKANLIRAYLVGLRTAPLLNEWSNTYSKVQNIAIERLFLMKDKSDMGDCFDNYIFNELKQEEKDKIWDSIQRMKEDCKEIEDCGKEIINAINDKVEFDPDERRNLPDNYGLDFEHLLNDQKFVDDLPENSPEAKKAYYLKIAENDYKIFQAQAEGGTLRNQFANTFEKLAKGEKLFQTQPAFAEGRKGKEQILNYLNDLEKVGTKAFVEMYGSNNDKNSFNLAHSELSSLDGSAAENAKSGYYRDGSLRDDQIEKMIYDSLSFKEKYMDAFNMESADKAGDALDGDNKSTAFEILNQAKEAYKNCSPLSKFFGLIFPTDANKYQKQIDFIRADLVKKGMTKEEIKMTEDARLVAEPLSNDRPAKSNEIEVDEPKQEINKEKESVDMSKEFGKGGLGEFDNNEKTEQIDKNKDLSANKNLDNSKNDIEIKN